MLAADISTNPAHLGRGGWTWYTGSAAWMYRLITESLLGLRLEGDHLRLDPRVPPVWGSYKIHYRYRETPYHITVQVGAENGVTKVICDGVERPDQTVPLVDDRRDHQIEVQVGRPR